MHKKLKYRYYCDFCKKSTGSASSMKKHESICTLNIDRTCGMCMYVDEIYNKENILEALELLKPYQNIEHQIETIDY